MKSFTPLALAIALGVVLISPVKSFAGDDWRPVNPAEVALKAPVVEKDADAEAIFWEVRIDDNPEGDLILSHYIRIKVFTERGRESQSKVDIPFGKIYGNDIKIKDIAARTFKVDGSIAELKKEDIFERTIVKGSGLKLKAKSFAIPGVEPGCLIEYRWREIRVGASAHYIRAELQREIPVQQVKYLLKPFPYPGYGMRSLILHGEHAPFVKEKEGFYSTSMTNVPALHEESRMPPENQLKIWMLIFYSKDEKLDVDKYWTDLGKRMYEQTKSLLKVNDEVRQAAATVVADAKTEEEKIQRLYEFCRTKIRNVSDDASGLTPEERKKMKDNKSPSDTLKRGVGVGADIDLLFAALATASGFDARIVLAPDRGNMFFNKDLANSYFLQPSNIAVKIGENWQFFNPGLNYVPFGMLRWQEEGTQSLITDPKQPIWKETPFSAPDKSRIKRRAKLKISEDGTVEGDVQVEFTGQPAIERKEENDNDTQNEREETLKDEVKSHWSNAELSELKIENVTDPVKPFIHSYHIKVPGYAQRTGKRLLIRPAFFQYGRGPLFSASERRYPVYFHYPWMEDDEVTFEVPEGFALDNADAPGPFSAGPIGEYKPVIGISKDGKIMRYRRSFFFGGNGVILFPVQSYAQLKSFFDLVHKSDTHTISFKQAAATAGSQ